MKVLLAAVGTTFDPERYKTEEAFFAWVDELVAEATQGQEADARVVAFPELFGLPLLFWLDAPEEAYSAKKVLGATVAWAKRLGLGTVRFFHRRARETWPVYRRALTEAAKKYEAYIFSGSWFAPRLEEEPSRGLFALGIGVYNWGFWANPKGAVLARAEKLRLTPIERAALIRPGQWEGQVAKTKIGTLGALICLDGFEETLIERVDAAGAWLLVQASANPAPWEAPWRADPSRKEGEVWIEEGLKKKLLGRENLRYGLNPMVEGQFYELSFEGRSAVVRAGEVLELTRGTARALVEL